MTPTDDEERQPPARWAALFLGYAAAALWVYRRALTGDFVSDDLGYVLANPWVHELSLANLRAILEPAGPVAAHTANYAPVHMLLHAAGWRLFGSDPTGHHALNVVVHAGACALVAALYARAGLSFAAAAVAGGVLLLHPANVEAVAWIFQLKTVAALALAAAALVAEPRRPLVAATLFALALLTKIQAAFALPVAAVWAWLGSPAGARPRSLRLAWLGLWGLALALALAPELLAFERMGHAGASPAEGVGGQARFMAALLGRYLAMAASGWGIAAFHQPDPPGSWLDPWCLLGLAGSAAMALRGAIAWRRRHEEAAFWAWVAGGFLPISQLLPFLYPMADRYLYYVLPGLVGALALALAPRIVSESMRRAALALALLVLVGFGFRVQARAAIWRSDLALALDSARVYPAGIPARRLAAQAAARRGDAGAAAEALRAAAARGFDRFMDLERDPSFDPVRADPRFHAALVEIAGRWIASVERRERPTAQELVMLGQAHAVRGEWDAAIHRLEQALAAGGPGSEGARAELARVRAARGRAARARAAGQPDDGAATP
jgi:hypothetical protein